MGKWNDVRVAAATLMLTAVVVPDRVSLILPPVSFWTSSEREQIPFERYCTVLFLCLTFVINICFNVSHLKCHIKYYEWKITVNGIANWIDIWNFGSISEPQNINWFWWNWTQYVISTCNNFLWYPIIEYQKFWFSTHPNIQV